MFKTLISDTIYDRINIAEGKKPSKAQSYLYKVLKKQPVTVLSKAETERLKNKPEDVLKHPSSLYILDIPKETAENIQRDYGVICLSGDNPDISLLIDINDEHTTEEREPLEKGWDSVLNSVEHLPSNGLILTDRYLFNNDNPNYGNGFDNVRSILTELLPDELNTTYYITIIFDKDHINESYDFNSISKELNSIVDSFRQKCNYPITLEVLGITNKNRMYHHLHNRRIVSNYFVVKMDYSLAAFNKTIGTAEQTIIPQVLFTEDSLTGVSSPPLKSLQQITKNLKKFSQALLWSPTIHSTYKYAVDGERKEKCYAIRNRLIK